MSYSFKIVKLLFSKSVMYFLLQYKLLKSKMKLFYCVRIWLNFCFLLLLRIRFYFYRNVHQRACSWSCSWPRDIGHDFLCTLTVITPWYFQFWAVVLSYGTAAVRLTESTWISCIGVPPVLLKATQSHNRWYVTLSVGLCSSPQGLSKVHASV